MEWFDQSDSCLTVEEEMEIGEIMKGTNGDEEVRILVVGDPHFRTNNAKETEEFIDKFIDLVKSNSFDLLVIMGDFMHTHETAHIMPFCRVHRLLEELYLFINIYILIGNHDRINNSDFLTERHFFGPYKKWPNIHIIDTGDTLTYKWLNIIFSPYVPPGRFDEALRQILKLKQPTDITNEINHPQPEISNISIPSDLIQSSPVDDSDEPEIINTIAPGDVADAPQKEKKEEKREINIDISSSSLPSSPPIPSSSSSDLETELQRWDVIFSHQDFFGALFAGGASSTVGDVWSEARPLVINGHIHNYSWQQNNLVNVGTPMQHAFDETINKAVTVFTWKKKGEKPGESRINLGLTKKIEVTLTYNDYLSYYPDENYCIKITLKGTSAEINAIKQSRHYMMLKKKVFKIVESTIPDEPIPNQLNTVQTKIPYIQKFQQVILQKQSPDLFAAWNEIFLPK